MSKPQQSVDVQEPPPGTDLHEGSYCWKCNGTGYIEVKRKRQGCKVCGGTKIIKSRKRLSLFNKPGIVMPERNWPADSDIPGPNCAEDTNSEELKPKMGEAICSLVGKWKIFQKQGGHRFSTDDVTTAWVACEIICSLLKSGQEVKTHLDMGCGLGSVLMMVAWKYPALQSIGIEAQSLSCALARRSLQYNGITDRVQVIHGDLREMSLLPEQRFDVITGTPPYFKVGEGALSAKVDQKACLFEFRGGVEEYISAANRFLSENGHCILVESSLGKNRFDQAAKTFNMKMIERIDFIPKEGKPSLFSIAHLVKGTSEDGYPVRSITIRNKEGLYTKEYHQLLIDMGFPPQHNVVDSSI